MGGWREWTNFYDYGSYPVPHDVGTCETIRLATTDVMEYILSNSRGSKYVIMDYRKRKNNGESQKTMAGTSNSQKCILEREMKSDDKDMKSDTLVVDHHTNQDLLREQSKKLADATRGRCNSEAERAENAVIQEHLPEEKTKDPALLEERSVHCS